MSERDEPTLAEAAALVRERGVSAVELTRGALERIDALNPTLNCFVTVLHERALAQADALDRLLASGVHLGPLHGVPVALKDNIATAGVRTTAGSRVLADRIPEHDAAVVTRLARAGAVLLGKLSMYELAYGDFHPDFDEVRNPWDTSRCCAGSSTGSACAVAARLAFGSLGTDIGGSIRLPAAACGVVGLKPTYGLVSRVGVLPGSYSLDHVGPLGRTVEDVALQLQAIAGHDPRDPGSDPRPVPDPTAALDLDVRGLRVGVPRRQPDELTEPVVRAAYEAALSVLEGEGAVLIDVEVPSHLEARSMMWAISAAELADLHRDDLRRRAHDYSPRVRQAIQSGAFLPATAYVRAQRVRELFRQRYAEVMRSVDVVALPVLALPAWPVGAETVTIDGAEEPVLGAFTRYATAANMTGQPAVSVPCGFDGDGLPLAFELVGRPRDDATVLRVARAYERATEWHKRVPPTEALLGAATAS